MTGSGVDDREHELGRLVDECVIDPSSDAAAIARRIGLDEAVAHDCVVGLEALRFALGEDLPGDARRPVHLPRLPDDLELCEELGRGGMGVVYRARQRSLGRDVAVKILLPADLALGDSLRRFEREARSLASLRHPNIVSVHSIGRADGSLYFTMDLIEGRSLQQLVHDERLTPRRATHIVRQAASAVDATHRHGLVHRDIKPSNILVDAHDHASMVDFGLVRDSLPAVEKTAPGHILGTPDYMSPEQARGCADEVGEASDIYSLGATLYTCLTGRAPFSGRGLADLLHAVIHDDPVRPTRIDSRVPRGLELICAKAMAKAPEHRYPTARALLEDLERFEQGLPTLAQPPTRRQRCVAWMRRHPVALGVTLLGVALALLIDAFVLPRLGMSVMNRLALARQLEAAGDLEAAVAVYRRGLPESGEIPADPRDDALMEVRSEALRASVRAALERARLGRLGESVALLLEATTLPALRFDDQPRDVRIEALGRLARIAAEAGSYELAEQTLGRLLAVVQLDPLEKYGLRSLDAFRAWSATPWRTGDRGSEPGPFALLLVDDPASWPILVRWLGTSHLDATTAALNVLPLLADAPPSTRYLLRSGLDRSASLEPTDEDLERWARFMEDTSHPLVLRRSAAACATSLCDMPDRAAVPPTALTHDTQPVDDETDLMRVCERLRGLVGLDRAESYRRRVGLAVADWSQPDLSDEFRVALQDWLARHVEAPVDADWGAWWTARGGDDPRTWLGDEREPSGSGTSFDRYLRATGVARARAHHRLALSLPGDVRAPVWPSYAVEPPPLPDRWAKVSSAAEHPGFGSIALARYRTREGGALPEFLAMTKVGAELRRNTWWEQDLLTAIRTIELGLRIPMLPEVVGPTTHLRTGETFWDWFDAPCRIVLGEDVPRTFLMIGDERLRIDYSVGVADERLVVDFTARITADDPDVGARLALGVRCALGATVALFPGADPAAFPIDLAAPDLIVLAGVIPPLREHEPAIAVLEEGLLTAVQDLAAALDSKTSNLFPGLGPPDVREHNLLAVASFFPLPQARAALARLDAARRVAFADHPDDFERCLALPARLLAGDVTALDEPDLEHRLALALPALQLGPDYLCRVILHGGDERLSAFAAQKLLSLPLAESEVALATLVDRPAAQQHRLPTEVLRAGRQARERAARRASSELWLRGLTLLTLGLLVLVSFVRCAVRSTRGTLSPGSGWLLVGAGWAISSVRVVAGGEDLLPIEIGFALAAAGALGLARRNPRRIHSLPAILMLTACIASLLERGAESSVVLPWVACGAAASFLVFARRPLARHG